MLRSIHAKGRDNARTPMQWTDAPHGGFTTGTPWLAANNNFTHINARAALADPQSVFHHYRQLVGKTCVGALEDKIAHLCGHVLLLGSEATVMPVCNG